MCIKDCFLQNKPWSIPWIIPMHVFIIPFRRVWLDLLSMYVLILTLLIQKKTRTTSW